MIRALLSANPATVAEFSGPLIRAFAEAGLPVDLSPAHAPDRVDYLIYAPGGGLTDFRPYTAVKAVLSLWAGVEKIIGNPTLPPVLCRMVDPGLTRGMVEYVTARVLHYHLGLDRYAAVPPGTWRQHTAPLAPDRPVTILGAGELGRACAMALMALGFPVTLYSRTSADLPGARCVSGADGLTLALQSAQILITLLPLTPQTEGIVNATTLALLPPGAALINPGRGALINDQALLDALDRGHLSAATLDVFRAEPLPADHAFWRHTRITITPHIAAATRPDTAARVIAENIRRGEAGEPWLHRVGMDRGY
jgi:glyoxylate/hydroxypyruvate reductase